MFILLPPYRSAILEVVIGFVFHYAYVTPSGVCVCVVGVAGRWQVCGMCVAVCVWQKVVAPVVGGWCAGRCEYSRWCSGMVRVCAGRQVG